MSGIKEYKALVDRAYLTNEPDLWKELDALGDELIAASKRNEGGFS